MQPGLELDEKVCRLLGWDPVAFEVSGVTFFTRSHAEIAAKSYGPGAAFIEHWHAVSTDGNAMLRAIEAMREQGFNLSEIKYWDSHGYVVSFCPSQRGGKSHELPHAVALAILGAIGEGLQGGGA